MHYFSTKRQSPNVSFRDAVLRGQPDDSGLFFPGEIARLPTDFISRLDEKPNEQIAFDCVRPYVGGEIPDDDLYTICSETVDFEFPLFEISDRISALELFHGPTLAFKDVGARFMSRCLRYFSRGSGHRTIVLVATSGDTGGAVAAGFHGVEGVEVVILYPAGKVSRVQELQLTTLGGNVTTLELLGTFDDCQALAKQALADADITDKVRLTSANSINIARWLPQQFYYFFAIKQWEGPLPVFSVPSGNFGNLAAGILANVSGLPVKKFIAACNANDVVPRYMRSGEYRPSASVSTFSNAMDVGDPSNFVRILEIFNHDLGVLKERLDAITVSDKTTAATMLEVHSIYKYTLDPHGAVGYRALADYLEANPDGKGIFLETAHPVKFDSVSEIIGQPVALPPAVEELFSKEKVSIKIGNSYGSLKEILLSRK